MKPQNNHLTIRLFVGLTVIVIITSFLLLNPIFKFALAGGEDWLTLYRYLTRFSNLSSHFNLINYTGNYDAGNILMGIIYRLFGFGPLPYYIASFVLRIFVSITLFIAVFGWTKNRLSAFLSALLFSISFAGIETTNYAFNMTTYASLGVFNIFMFLYEREVNNKISLKTVVVGAILFLSFYLAPHRVHGLILLLPFIVLLRTKLKDRKKLLTSLGRLIIFLTPLIIYRLSTSLSLDKDSISMLSELLDKKFGIIFYPLSIVGSSIFPDRVVASFIDASSPLSENISTTVFSLILPIVVIFTLLSYSIFKGENKVLSKITRIESAYVIASILFLVALINEGLPNLKNPITAVEALIGSFTLITMIYYFKLTLNKFKSLSLTGLFGLTATVILIIIPWLARSTATFPSDHRYLLIPSAAFLVSLSCLISIMVRQRKLFASSLLIIVVILINISALNGYFQYNLKSGREKTEVGRYFDQIKSGLPAKIGDGLLVFLFTTKDDPMTLHNAITFGFSNHLVLVDSRFSQYSSTKVLAVDNKQSLIKILKDPESSEFYRYGIPNSEIDIENVYSYDLKNKNLTNTTPHLREELSRSFFEL